MSDKPLAPCQDEPEDLPIMDERDWPIYAVLLKTGEMYWHDTSWGNRYNTGDGWLMVLPWGEQRERGGFHRGDNRFGVEHEDVSALTLLNDRRASPAVAATMPGDEEVAEALKCADASANWKLANLKRCADALIPLARALIACRAEMDGVNRTYNEHSCMKRADKAEEKLAALAEENAALREALQGFLNAPWTTSEKLGTDSTVLPRDVWRWLMSKAHDAFDKPSHFAAVLKAQQEVVEAAKKWRTLTSFEDGAARKVFAELHDSVDALARLAAAQEKPNA